MTGVLQGTGQLACHVKVKEVAVAAAGELYETMMGDDRFFAAWKKQNPGANAKELERRFVDRNWPKCLDFARHTMVLMLRQPDVSEKVKDEILDVLEKDKSLQGKVVMQ